MRVTFYSDVNVIRAFRWINTRKSRLLSYCLRVHVTGRYIISIVLLFRRHGGVSGGGVRMASLSRSQSARLSIIELIMIDVDDFKNETRLLPLVSIWR